eukprot:scaffold13560_cov161-Cylindrotheca_fusiformis.AAC.2
MEAFVAVCRMFDTSKALSAVQRAKRFGLPQRAQNSGHDPSLWKTLQANECDQQGTTTENDNNLFLPQAILIGVQKGGTTALYEYLDQHPQIAKTKKELYFLDETMDDVLLKWGTIPRRVGRNLYHQKLRESMINPHATATTKNKKKKNQQQQHSFVMDWTPNYMLHSDRVPSRIECLVPWVRLLVLLRNPIDRARSQYEMKLAMTNPKRRRHNPIPTLDEYIVNDLNALEELGVLHDWTKVDFETFWKSADCWKAWEAYIHSGLNAPVGMGLYALQLKPFLDMLAKLHPNDHWTNYLLALDSHDLQHDTDNTFQRVLQFLNLSPMSLQEYPVVNQGKREHDMLSHETRIRFEMAIEPFNRKLVELLGDEWQDKWRRSSSL